MSDDKIKECVSFSTFDPGIFVSCKQSIYILCSIMCDIICSRFVISSIPLTLSAAREDFLVVFPFWCSLIFFVVVFHKLILCVPMTALNKDCCYDWFACMV